MTDEPPEDRRRELFAALVAAQDGDLSVTASRQKVATEYGVGVELVEAIEGEGLAAEWPPLDG